MNDSWLQKALETDIGVPLAIGVLALCGLCGIFGFAFAWNVFSWTFTGLFIVAAIVLIYTGQQSVNICFSSLHETFGGSVSWGIPLLRRPSLTFAHGGTIVSVTLLSRGWNKSSRTY